MDDLIDKAKEAFDSGEFLRAASYIMDYIAQDPPEEKLQVAYRMRGTARGILGQNDEAKYDLNKALGLNPKDNISRVNRAMVYKEMENYEQSSRDCFHVLDAKEEGMAQAYFCLGEINLKFGIMFLGKKKSTNHILFSSRLSHVRPSSPAPVGGFLLFIYPL